MKKEKLMKRSILILTLVYLFSVLSGSNVFATTVSFTFDDLGEIEIYMFKLSKSPVDTSIISGDLGKGENYSNPWTYQKTSETVQVYDFASISSGSRTPLSGNFLTFDVPDDAYDITTQFFTSDNFEFGSYDDGEYFGLDISYSFDSGINTSIYNFSAVPVPSAFLLLGGGICVLCGIRRNNRN
jgi:hypothetical protein